MRAKQSYLLIERLEIVKKCIESGVFPSSSDIIKMCWICLEQRCRFLQFIEIWSSLVTG